MAFGSAAFRYFRVLLRLNNRNLFNHLMKIDAFGPILDLTLRESRRDNLLSSTCQEFFEHIRKVWCTVLLFVLPIDEVHVGEYQGAHSSLHD